MACSDKIIKFSEFVVCDKSLVLKKSYRVTLAVSNISEHYVKIEIQAFN